MATASISSLLDLVYEEVGTFDPMAIVKAYDLNIIYADIGKETLGLRITNDGRTTIILSTDLPDNKKPLVLLHEIKHCLTDGGVGTPFLRRYCTNTPIAKREFEANSFAINAMIREYQCDLEGLTKYQICEFFGLNDNWARFI